MSKDYPPTRGPVLLLTCMDLRLMDDVVKFMDKEGLTNRYDHVALAGAALGALGAEKSDYEHWRKTFDDHVATAYKLRKFKDVIIIEHRDCGAYEEFLDLEYDDEHADDEAEIHLYYARRLREKLDAWAQWKGINIWVKSFLMDLRGEPELLEGPIKVGDISKTKKPPKRKGGKGK
jgi:hypothetical protein